MLFPKVRKPNNLFTSCHHWTLNIVKQLHCNITACGFAFVFKTQQMSTKTHCIINNRANVTHYTRLIYAHVLKTQHSPSLTAAIHAGGEQMTLIWATSSEYECINGVQGVSHVYQQANRCALALLLTMWITSWHFHGTAPIYLHTYVHKYNFK